MAWRRFVLQPAAEVAGSMIHPPTGWTIAQLLDHLDTAASYVAITGSIGAGKTRLAERLARQTVARLISEPLDLARLEAFYADPASHAWETELEFLEQRARMLAADAPEWLDTKQLALSDFWFDQSAAFARVWLPPEQWVAFAAHWEHARRGVVRPKLIVLLDLPADRLLDHVRRRGRRGEQCLSEQQLDQIRQAIVAQATGPDQGPLMRLTGEDLEEAVAEVLAAVEAME
jgi:deoxyadenosine/deoxycytidine kinase